jgi:glycosyltransferase involved in cell wall biosynthesis
MWSVCVIARDEETNVARCLGSVPATVDRVVVVDDRTRDGTARWAEVAGARVVWRAFDGWSEQRNAGLGACRGDRVLFLDADETLSDAARAWLDSGVDDGAAGWSFPFRTWWLGRRLRFGRMGRTRHVRAIRRGAGEWRGRIHESLHVHGRVSRLGVPIDHQPYVDLWDHLDTIRRYAAVQRDDRRPAGPAERWLRAGAHVLDSLVLRGGALDGVDGVAVSALGALSTWAKWSR